MSSGKDPRLDEAAALRDEGMAAVEAAADPRVIVLIDGEIELANKSGRRWSANDIRDRLPVSAHQLVGARVRAAARRKDCMPVGYTPSTLPSTHAHPIRVWLGTEAHNALHGRTAATTS